MIGLEELELYEGLYIKFNSEASNCSFLHQIPKVNLSLPQKHTQFFLKFSIFTITFKFHFLPFLLAQHNTFLHTKICPPQ